MDEMPDPQFKAFVGRNSSFQVLFVGQWKICTSRQARRRNLPPLILIGSIHQPLPLRVLLFLCLTLVSSARSVPSRWLWGWKKKLLAVSVC